VAYWVEPKYVWRYGRPLARDDIRTADEATPRIQHYIRRAFKRYTERSGKPRFMEKTPSNCFRVPFVHAVLPNARFLHIIRDGRDVARSAVKKWTTPPDPAAIRRRFKSFEIPLLDIPFYVVDMLREVVGRQFFPERALVWGPRFPEIRKVRAEEGVEAACATQWQESVRSALEGLVVVPPNQQMTVQFEDLVRDPTPNLISILEFLSLSLSDDVLDYASEIIERTAASRWRNDGIDATFELRLQPLLSELGYN